ncbi:MAG: hypothetical protein IM606_15730 [Cytophagales bacterium]|jgi:hypothetical protein|nr:hypothetical protein [Cytophagales bacterium]MCA6392560.1 hypothetical protein [Cytophagales bacterium]MCA6396633.1 hypothetical protein [Cytophagales bacterium]MCA6401668.1 hypothetical protein [Cytophagales bacterium]MCA6410234.1 hypothetical protein [Cytophagales bacterium]
MIELKKYLKLGQFEFQLGDRLVDKCESVPIEPGVYIFKTVKNGAASLVYIGASGTMRQNGKFANQLLKGRLNNMQNSKTRRQDYFESEIAKNQLDCIKVNWWVTFDQSNKDLPMYVEALLIQKYFDSHKKLPEWNTEF